MRKVKKLLGLLLAAVMVLAMGVPTFAASGEYTITINNALAGHTYQAYQVFAGDLSENEETLSNVTWGDGVDGTAILTALKGTEEETTAYENCTTAADVAKVLETYGENSSEMKAFADIVGQHLTETTSGTLSAYNSENQSYTISGLAAGYYFIKDADTVAETDAYTDFILKLTNDETITRKADVPTVEKKVQEDDKDITNGENENYGEGYNDVADWNIGDAVPFKLIGTLPTNFADYDTYQYIFHDTLSAGLDLNEESIAVYYASDKAGTDKTSISSDNYTIHVPGTEDADQCSFEVAFADLTSVEGVNAEKYIIVEYTATLKTSAEIGLPGNPNRVYLEFSNNPNSGGEGDTGETPEDKVIVFTYELDVTKVDGKDANTKLEDAEFKLYDANGKYVIVDDEGKVTGWADNEEGGSTLKSGEDGLFKVIGLDDGTYWLKETKSPDGYNLITDPIKIEIKATTVNDQEWTAMEGPSDALTALEIKVTVGSTTTSGNGDTESGIVETDIKNNKGAELPETGGMGTTIFYVLGAILVLGAGVLLIARRRTDSEK